jgi:hypothetical protein
MVDIQTISIAVASASVTLAAIYYVWQIRHQSKIRQIDLVMRLYSTFGSKEHMDAYREVMAIEAKDSYELRSKYSGSSVSSAFGMVCAFYEEIGVLLRNGLIGISLVDDLFSTDILQIWEKIEHLVKKDRERLKRPQVWEWFEYLYNEMKKREQRIQ